MPSVNLAENLLCKGCYHYIYGSSDSPIAVREAKAHAPEDPLLQQIRALENVYRDTNGEGWKDNSGWDALASLSATAHQAKGVCLRKTKSDFFAVTKLDLANNLLAGGWDRRKDGSMWLIS